MDSTFGSSYSLAFSGVQDERASHPVFSTYTEPMNTSSPSGPYESSQSSYPQWIPPHTYRPDTFEHVPSFAPYNGNVRSVNEQLDHQNMSSWLPEEPPRFIDIPYTAYDANLSPRYIYPPTPFSEDVGHTHFGAYVSEPARYNEYPNVFDFDFASSVPVELSPSSSPTDFPSVPPMRSSRNSFSGTSSCSSTSSWISEMSDNLDVKSRPSRESSPSTAESDHSNQRRRFPCPIPGCCRRFTSQYTLKVHVEAHKPKPRVSYPCTHGCSEKFSRQHDRLRHEVAKHGKICEFLCDECGRFFSTKKTLGNHKCPAAHGGTRWVNS